MEAIAPRYALALFKIAQEQATFSSLHQQLVSLHTLIEQDRSWFTFLNNPFYTMPQKEALIQTVFPQATWGSLPSLMRLLIKNHRIRILPAIIKESIKLCEETLKIKHGQLFVANALSIQQRQDIETALATQLGVQLTLVEVIEPALLGGFRVEIDGKVYDTSILGKLEALTRHLKQRG
jgi:F-type H+-transporting ATPase subunit delta